MGYRMIARLGLALVCLVSLFSLLNAAAAQSKLVVWGHGAWSWFGDPRAVYVQSPQPITFVGWIGWNGDITIGEYDPRFGLMRSHVVGHEYHDDHSVPSILVEPDNQLTLFWSGHNGSKMYYRTSAGPEEIASWGPLEHVSSSIPGVNGFTYPNPMTLSDENDRLYLFWRSANYSQAYETRTSSGKWSQARELISQPGQRPYVKYATNGTNTIAMAFTNGHPRNVLTSIYFAEYRDGWLRGADGRPIKRLGTGPILPDQGDVVYNARSNGVHAWVWDVALDPAGRPVIVYATFPSNNNHAYWYAQWTGTRWVSHLLTRAGGSISPTSIEYEYSGGIALNHSDPGIVYLSRQMKGGWDLERWVTKNGGRTFSHSVVVPADNLQNVRPVVPRGGGPIQVLFLRGEYNTYTTYRTSIAFLTGP
jgi:BNR repeat-containing family member